MKSRLSAKSKTVPASRASQGTDHRSADETIHGAGDMVTVETRWEGIVNVPLGTLKPGDAMVAHICMVFTLRDGMIVRQVNYDCYEPF